MTHHQTQHRNSAVKYLHSGMNIINNGPRSVSVFITVKKVKTHNLFFFLPTTKWWSQKQAPDLPLMTCVRCLLMDSWFWILNNQPTRNKAHFALAQWMTRMFFIDIFSKCPNSARDSPIILLYSLSFIPSFKVKTCLSKLWLAHLALPGQSRFPKKALPCLHNHMCNPCCFQTTDLFVFLWMNWHSTSCIFCTSYWNLCVLFCGGGGIFNG